MASPEESTDPNVLEKLQEELKQEALSRQLQEELNSKLQDEYDVLLKRLAEAELHIDRMRFCPGVEFDKFFLIRHHTEQHSTLKQMLAANLDPARQSTTETGNDAVTEDLNSNRTLKSTGVGTDSAPPSCEGAGRSNTSSRSVDQVRKDRNTTANSSDDENFEHSSSLGSISPNVHHGSRGNAAKVPMVELEGDSKYISLSPHVANSRRGRVRSPGERKGDSVSRRVHDGDSQDNTSHSSEEGHSDNSVSSLNSSNSAVLTQLRNKFKGRSDSPSESQELLLTSSFESHSPSLTRPPILNSTHHRTLSSSTDTDDTSLSEMSPSTEENRGSAESMQLAHLFKVHSLQEELSHLKTKLNDRDIPLDDIIEDLSQIHREHEGLARDVDASSAQLDGIRRRYNGKVPDRLAKTRRAVGNELSNLVDQLQEFYELVNARAKQERGEEEKEEKEEVNLPPSTQSPEGHSDRKHSDSRLSNTFYDSLNSPHLPAKYLNPDTSTDNQHQSSEGLPLATSPAHSLTPPPNSTYLQVNGEPTRRMTRIKSPAHVVTPPTHSTPRGSNARPPGHTTGTGCNSHIPSLTPPTDSAPLESNSGTTLSNSSGSLDDSEVQSNSDLQPRNRHASKHKSKNVKSKNRSGRAAMDQKRAHKDGNSHPQRSPVIDSRTDTPGSSDLDFDLSDEELHVQNDTTLSSNESSDRSDDRDVNLMRSPDSYYLQQAKKNLKKAQRFGYGSGSGEHYHSQKASGDGRKNKGQSTKPSTKSSSQIPQPTPSQFSPHFQSPRAISSQHWPNSTACGTSKDQSHMTFPGEADSGFAGSEFPSRTATRMDTSSPTGRGRYRSSVLQSTGSEEDVNRQRFEEATAAIEALRKELADIKLQMMRNAKRQTDKHQESIPPTPSSHSHSTIQSMSHSHSTIQPMSCSHSTVPQYSPSAATGNSLNNYLNSNQQRRENGEYADDLSTPPSLLHQVPSCNPLSDGQSSTSSLPTNSLHSLASSSHLSLTGGQMNANSNTTQQSIPPYCTEVFGGQTSQLTTDTPKATPLHLLSSHHQREALLVSGKSTHPPTNNQLINTASHPTATPLRNCTGGQLNANTTTTESMVLSRPNLRGRQTSQLTTDTPKATPLHLSSSDSICDQQSLTGERMIQPPSYSSAQLISTPSRSVVTPLHTLTGGQSTRPTTIPSQLITPHHSLAVRQSTHQPTTALISTPSRLLASAHRERLARQNITPSHSTVSPQHSLAGEQSTHPASPALGNTSVRSLASAHHRQLANPLATPSHSVSHHHSLAAGVQSTQLIDTPSHVHSLKSSSPSHSYTTPQTPSSVTLITAASAKKTATTDFNSPISSPIRNPSSLKLSNPALLSSINSTPVPTPQHSTTSLAKSNARTNSDGLESHFSSDPSSNIVCVSGFTSDDHFQSETYNIKSPEHYLGKEDGGDSTGHCYYPTQSNSLRSVPPSRISSFNDRSSLNQYRVPSYHSEQARSGVYVRRESDGSLSQHSSGHKPDMQDVRRSSSDVVRPDSAPNKSLNGASLEQRVADCSHDNQSLIDQFCPNCRERAKKTSRYLNERRFSDCFVTDRHTASPYSCGSTCGSSCEEKGNHKCVQNGRKNLRGEVERNEVEESLAGQCTQTDPDVHGGQRRKFGSSDFSQSISFSKTQRPMATSTPSRNTVINSRLTQTRSPANGGDKSKGKVVNLARNVSKRGSFNTPCLPTSDDGTDTFVGVASNKFNSLRQTPSVGSHSPKRKRSTEMHAASTQSSPTHSHVYGFNTDTFSSAHSSPALRHSDVRRASSPGSSASSHKMKAYRRVAVDDNRESQRTAYNVRLPTDTSSDSEESYHEVATHWTPSRPTSAAHDNVVHSTPCAHRPTSAKRNSIRQYEPSREHMHVHSDHYIEQDNNMPEHLHVYVHGDGRVKTPVVKVIETPKVKKKKRVVYLASSPTPSPDEVYYTRGGSRFTPKLTSRRKRVVDIAQGAETGGRSAGRGARKKRVYLEPTRPKKRVYVVEQSSGGSGSDAEHLNTLETCDLDLEDTLRLAKELKKRTRRLQGTLQAELDRQRYH